MNNIFPSDVYEICPKVLTFVPKVYIIQINVGGELR